MLREKHPCQDPIERKVLKVELLHNSSIIDEAEARSHPPHDNLYFRDLVSQHRKQKKCSVVAHCTHLTWHNIGMRSSFILKPLHRC